MEEKEENLKRKTEDLQLLIEKYKKKLDEVRSDCSCKKSKIKMIKNENGISGDLRLVCLVCSKVVGYPSKKDIDYYYNNC